MKRDATSQEISEFIKTNRSEFWEKYRNDVILIEVRFGKDVAYHTVHTATYNEMRSERSFKHREMERAFGKISTESGDWVKYARELPLYFNNQIRATFEMELAISKMVNVDFIGNKPRYEHATIFDFYKAIGYDYKKKKYIEKS